MFGYDSSDEILGASQIFHCSNEEMPKTIIEKLEKNKEHIFQFKAKRKDNSTFDILMATKYINFNGKKFYIGSSLDISENLKLSKQYETIFNNVREGIILRELDGTIIDVNPYIEKLHNVTKDKLIGLNVYDFFKSQDIDKINIIKNTLKKEKRIKYETKLKKLDGSLFYASIESQVIEFEDRQLVYTTVKDLTLENENILLLERSKQIFENIEEGVMITNQDGYITEVNIAFKSITGYSYYEALGNKASILKSGKHNKRFYEKMWENLQNRSKWSGKIINKKKNGETYTSFLTISAIKDKEVMFKTILEYLLTFQRS